jgi:hypothetical protein
MKKLVWCYVLDTKGLTDLYTVNGTVVTHPQLHTIIATHPTNPNLGSTCGKKLFHSKTDIIYPLELEKMVECYHNTPVVPRHVVNHGNDVVNHSIQIINT